MFCSDAFMHTLPSRKQSLIHDNQDEHNAMLTGTLSLNNGLAGVGRGRVMQSHQIVRTE